ncbi:hypothetical protein AVV36_gp130 [Pectobacterium bacteriophage PM2]|uniref:Uncharacterized protein n=1 Tax=Pectobacterium bacteriophage PM2 TaxID=1429794 RepID=A0A0A0Q3G6_9CAUD|nr:hypothetical protein AVV36_gp130 [Pectobacterium bacteriophage PM2]AHY25092.1 hypothetical protein PM2_130 [Pectobacterium bacteriophage PM2]
MKTYQEFLTEASVREDEYNLAASKVGAKSKNAFRNLSFGWDITNTGNLAEKISISAHVSKSRTNKKNTSLAITSGYSTWTKAGSVSSGFDNIDNIVKSIESVRASIKGLDVKSVDEFLKAQGWKKL